MGGNPGQPFPSCTLKIAPKIKNCWASQPTPQEKGGGGANDKICCSLRAEKSPVISCGLLCVFRDFIFYFICFLIRNRNTVQTLGYCESMELWGGGGEFSCILEKFLHYFRKEIACGERKKKSTRRLVR